MNSWADAIEQPGNPRHPEHDAFLLELGRGMYAASQVAGIRFDILRVFHQVASAAMYNDPLGTLLNRLQGLDRQQPDLPGLSAFVGQLEAAVKTRNDLFHALPVKDGLHRRKAKDATYVRNFYTVEDVRKAVEELVATHRAGSGVLYHDGGAAVRVWYEKGGS